MESLFKKYSKGLSLSVYLVPALIIIYIISISSMGINKLDLSIKETPDDVDLQIKRNYEIYRLSVSSIFLILVIILAIFRPTDILVRLYDIAYIFPIFLLLLYISLIIQSAEILYIIVITASTCVLIWRVRESVNKNDIRLTDERISKIPNPTLDI